MVLQPVSRKFALLGSLALAAAVTALYLRSTGLGYIYSYDDGYNIFSNPHMGPPSFARLKWCFTNWEYTRRYMPLGWTEISLTYLVGHLNPAPYHWVALLWTALSSAALFVVTLLAIRAFTKNTAQGLAPRHLGCAFAAAAWWGLHPLRVETTTWISGMLYGQSGFFAFVSVALHLRGLIALEEKQSRSGWVTASLVFCALSLATYPIALGVPPALIAADWLYLRLKAQRNEPTAAAWKVLLPGGLALGLGSLTLAATLLAKTHADVKQWGGLPSLAQDPVTHKIAKAAYSLVYYAWRPWQPTHLSLVYETLFHPSLTPTYFRIDLAVTLAVGAAALAAWRRWPAFTAVALAYAALTLPFAGLAEDSHIPSDRYAYLNQALIAVTLGVVLSLLKPKAARWALGATALFSAGFSIETYQRQAVWKNTASLFLDAGTSLHTKEGIDWAVWRLNSNELAEKEKIRAETALAYTLTREGDLATANDHLDQALSIKDHGWQLEYDKALLLLYYEQPNHVADSLRFYTESKRNGNKEPDKQRIYLTRLMETASREGLADIVSIAQKEEASLPKAASAHST